MTDDRPARGRGPPKHFGGVVAVDGCSFSVRPGTVTGADRPERLRQDDRVQHGHRVPARRLRHASASTGATCAGPTRRACTGPGSRAPSSRHACSRSSPDREPRRRGAAAAGRDGPQADQRRRAGHGDEILERFGLSSHGRRRASELSFGQRKLLEFATVLMGVPRLVLLDEPAAGVNPVMIEEMERHIRDLNARGSDVPGRGARHEPRHAPVRPGRRARPRREDRRGTRRRDQGEPGRARRVPGGLMAGLSIEDVVAGYGQGDILRGVDLEVASGTITCVIGPNGAGKSTVLKVVSALLQPTRGAIRLDGEVISATHPARRARPRRRARAAGAEPVPADDRVGQRADGRLHALGSRGRSNEDRGDRRAVPARAGTPTRARRLALGRGAEGRRDRPRDDARPAGGAHGRAVDGARPARPAARSSPPSES